MSNDIEEVISDVKFKYLCDLTFELTRLRQNECKHLCVENIAPNILGKLLNECAPKPIFIEHSVSSAFMKGYQQGLKGELTDFEYEHK